MHPFRHELVLDEEMVDEEGLFVMFRLLVYPEFVRGDVRVPVMLSEVRELLIDVPADIAAVHDPHEDVPPSVDVSQVGVLKLFRHSVPF